MLLSIDDLTSLAAVTRIGSTVVVFADFKIEFGG